MEFVKRAENYWGLRSSEGLLISLRVPNWNPQAFFSDNSVPLTVRVGKRGRGCLRLRETFPRISQVFQTSVGV